MNTETDIREFDAYLKSGRAVSMKPPIFADGSSIGDWMVLGFIGRGGSGEVYRVKRGNEIGAAKVLYKDDASAHERFRLEIEVLSKFGRDGVPSPSVARDGTRALPFPRFIESGVVGLADPCQPQSFPYLITEFLQPAELPRTDGALADYLLQICCGLSELHAAGLVHRDLKPMNIMRRENGELVIIDIGLVKDTWRGSRPQDGVSIVSGKAVAVGSPGYGAPEQFQGGAISPLTDIHALGRIANAAFDNHPPRNWEEIIRRSTSSIPEQRYGSVEEFAAAIRHRNDSRRFKTAAFIMAACLIGCLAFFGRARRPATAASSDLSRFRSLCHPTTITRVEQQLVWERFETNNVNGMQIVSPIRAFRTVTNEVDIVSINLNGATNVFAHPIQLAAGREYVFTGPGVFDVNLTGDGNAVTVRLEKCVFLNRTTKSLAASGIRYILDGCVYLNFTQLDRTEDYQKFVLPFDGASNMQLFKGPESVRDAEKLRDIKISKFSRKILSTFAEYIIESMEKRDTIRLDPNRIPTDAEVNLVAFIFDVDETEARSILASRANFNFKVQVNPETQASMSPGILACATTNWVGGMENDEVA